jgi:dTDP-4-amino-4,6-dideoxygalactose transaminase
MTISFIYPNITGLELHNIALGCFSGSLGEDGKYVKLVEFLIKESYPSTLLPVVTTSIGSSFDFAADLLNLEFNDEIILPSFTFVSGANAFAKRGVKLVFVDIDKKSLNIDLKSLAQSFSNKTRAIIVPHYSGIASNILDIKKLASERNIIIIEDLSGAFLTKNQSSMLGLYGDLACGSFHEDEFIHAGEAGFLLVNNNKYFSEATLMKYRGTNKVSFLEGRTEHFGWEIIGGEYCANEITCAFLYAQLKQAEIARNKRYQIWQIYHDLIQAYDTHKLLTLPSSKFSVGNFYIRLPEDVSRVDIIKGLKRTGIECRGHFYPLHLTAAGISYGNSKTQLTITESEYKRVLRLPSSLNIKKEEQDRIIKILLRIVES